jgi:hypothetical protein
MDLLRRYFNLLKITMISFILSTIIHVGLVSAYYYTFLYLNPDDPGKKKFYSTTTSTGVNIGGKNVGGGGIQTNHHKSYFLHLVREHYKGLSKLFFLEFSTIYCLILVLFKFFPERAKLQEETLAAFRADPEDTKRKVVRVKPTKQTAASLLRQRNMTTNQARSSNINNANSQMEDIDEYETDEEIIEQEDLDEERTEFENNLDPNRLEENQETKKDN